jgi:hypothetical protein
MLLGTSRMKFVRAGSMPCSRITPVKKAYPAEIPGDAVIHGRHPQSAERDVGVAGSQIDEDAFPRVLGPAHDLKSGFLEEAKVLGNILRKIVRSPTSGSYNEFVHDRTTLLFHGEAGECRPYQDD